MAQTRRFTAGADSFEQGNALENRAITLFMLAGNDSVLLDRDDDFGGRNRVDMGAGDDVVENHHEDGNFILLGAGNDRYGGSGFGSFANERADTVRGGGGNDVFGVSTFKSLYLGDAGRDTFFSAGERNDFDGGAGRDLIDYRLHSAGGIIVDLAQGLAQTGPLAQERLRRIEDLRGTDHADGDALAGNAAGNRITGGRGLDQMAGRGGADTFVWTSHRDAPVVADAIEVVVDFVALEGDVLDLRLIDANLRRPGNQAFSFLGEAEFTNHAGQLRFAELILEGDVNGDGRADFRIGLQDVAALGAGDILL